MTELSLPTDITTNPWPQTGGVATGSPNGDTSQLGSASTLGALPFFHACSYPLSLSNRACIQISDVGDLPEANVMRVQ